MVMRLPTISRRTMLGATLAAAVPRLAHGQSGRDPASQKPTDVRIKLTFGGRTMMATLYDNPSARDLATLLPLDLTIEDYGNNERIAYLPRKLTEDGSGPFGNERPGDLCYFKPWGQPGHVLRRLPVGRPDPARPLRWQLRAAAGARQVPAAH